MVVFAEIGTPNQSNEEKISFQWRDMKGVERPKEGDWICEAVDEIYGLWVERVPVKIWENGLTFMEEFTPEELLTIFNHGKLVTETIIWITAMAAAASIESTDPRTINGMAYLVYQGLITQARYDEVMT